jgi:prophage maintenance system killer protein
LRIPSLETVVAFNHSVRAGDEWFDEPDELHRVERLLSLLTNETDPVVAAALSVSRLTLAQAFTEGNKRTAVLVGLWILDRNGLDSAKYITEDDNELAVLLLRAARGIDVSNEVIDLFSSRK